MRIFFYLLAVVMANVITAKLPPLSLGIFLIPSGTFLIGATFILRDLVQNRYGKKNTYLLIGLALFLSAITSLLLGDTLWIVFASAISFLVSESTDTEIYSRLKLPLNLRVLYSGTVGGLLDSVLFVVIGMSPIGAGFITWDLVIYAILGQVVFKTLMQLIGALLLTLIYNKKLKHNF